MAWKMVFERIFLKVTELLRVFHAAGGFIHQREIEDHHDKSSLNRFIDFKINTAAPKVYTVQTTNNAAAEPPHACATYYYQ